MKNAVLPRITRNETEIYTGQTLNQAETSKILNKICHVVQFVCAPPGKEGWENLPDPYDVAGHSCDELETDLS